MSDDLYKIQSSKNIENILLEEYHKKFSNSTSTHKSLLDKTWMRSGIYNSGIEVAYNSLVSYGMSIPLVDEAIKQYFANPQIRYSAELKRRGQKNASIDRAIMRIIKEKTKLLTQNYEAREEIIDMFDDGVKTLFETLKSQGLMDEKIYDTFISGYSIASKNSTKRIINALHKSLYSKGTNIRYKRRRRNG